MSVYDKVREKIGTEGIVVLILRQVNRILNFLFNLLLLHRTDSDIDCTAKIVNISSIQIGKNFHAGRHLWLEAVKRYNGYEYRPTIKIGDNVSIQDFVHIGATNYIEIGDNVLMASKIYISDHNHGVYSGEGQSNPHIPPSLRELTRNQEIVIEKNAWIGESVTILPGVHIGEGSIIGANSVVTGDVPAFSVAVGTPAKVIKKYDFMSNEWVKIF